MWATCENKNKKDVLTKKSCLMIKRENFQKLKHQRKKNVVSLKKQANILF